jgi:hypothetical protein
MNQTTRALVPGRWDQHLRQDRQNRHRTVQPEQAITRPTGMRRILTLTTVILMAATACARSSKTSASPGAAFQTRASQVATAWLAAVRGPAGAPLRDGLVPLDDLTLPPAGGLTDDLRFALASGWFTTSVNLPAATPAPTTITFADGRSMTVPLVSAATAYTTIRKGDPPCRRTPIPAAASASGADAGSTGAPAQHTCAILTITGASLGTTVLRTSRGQVTVPAWLLTVAELSAPVARVAVAASAFSPVPSVSPPTMDTATAAGLVSVHKLTGAQDGSVSFTVSTGGCGQPPVAAVHETGDTVVIAATVDPTPRRGVCAGAAVIQPVSAALSSPLGSRVVLDAVTGRALVVDRSQW